MKPATALLPGMAMLAAVATAVVPLAGEPRAQPAPEAAASERYSTADTELGRLLDDPAARAILVKHLPGFVDNPRTVAMLRSATLKSIQGYAAQTLTDEVLARIDAELARLPARPRRPEAGDGRRLTTDEAKVLPYTLPDPLVLASGRPVADARTWWRQRRPEILSTFETQVYGRAPGRPPGQRFEVFDKGTPALGGKAIRKQVLIRIARDPSAPTIQLVQYLPARTRGPVPMLLTIGFTAPSAMFADPGIRPSPVWDQQSKRRVAATPRAGSRFDPLPFVKAGIGVAAFYYGDVEPDFAGGDELGVRGWYARHGFAPGPDTWGAIAAWAWGLSRVQDYLASDRAVDSRRVALLGVSRLGKTVLWAAARDQRFAAAIACCSGKLGAALMRRNFGAAIVGGESDFWTAGNYERFRADPAALPIDAHMLLALIAPRPLLLQTGARDYAADPKGEFLAAAAATPVYRLLGKQGLPATAWPPPGPVLGDIGFTMHEGGHGPAPTDWDVYLRFLQQHLR